MMARFFSQTVCIFLLLQLHLTSAVRWVTAWTDEGLGGSAGLAWADMGQSDALLELKSERKGKTKVLVEREVPPGTGHPYLFKLPGKDAIESGELQYDARYWFQVTSKETGESDDSPDYYLSRDDVLMLGTAPGDGGDEDSGDSNSDNTPLRPTSSPSGGNGDGGAGASPETNRSDKVSVLPLTETLPTTSRSIPTPHSPADDNKDEETTGTDSQSPASTSASGDETDDSGDSTDPGPPIPIIVGVIVGVGGGGLLIFGLFCFVKRRKRRTQLVTQEATMERDTLPSELSNEEAKAKQEVDSTPVYEKGEDEEMASELPGVVPTHGELHEDGRFGGRCEMPA